MPRGCRRDATLKELIDSPSLCGGLRPAQWETIKTLAQWWPDFVVTAPTWWPVNPLTSSPLDSGEEPHHFNDKYDSIDFGSPGKQADLLKAFLTLKEFWGGGLGLGLSGGPNQYGAQIHLHVDGRMGDGQYRRWFEVGSRPAKGGIALKTVTQDDKWHWQYFGTQGDRYLGGQKQKGIWNDTLADARKIYGYDAGPDMDIVQQVKDSEPGPLDDVLPLVAAAIVGAALGWDDKQPAKKWIYAGAALVLAYVVLNIRKSLKLLPAT